MPQVEHDIFPQNAFTSEFPPQVTAFHLTNYLGTKSWYRFQLLPDLQLSHQF